MSYAAERLPLVELAQRLDLTVEHALEWADAHRLGVHGSRDREWVRRNYAELELAMEFADAAAVDRIAAAWPMLVSDPALLAYRARKATESK